MKPNEIVKECEINLNRKFTRKEKKYILKWIKEYEFDFKTISLAFYYSTNKTHPNFEYLNNILTDWHDRGFKTRKDIELWIEWLKKKYNY